MNAVADEVITEGMERTTCKGLGANEEEAFSLVVTKVFEAMGKVTEVTTEKPPVTVDEYIISLDEITSDL